MKRQIRLALTCLAKGRLVDARGGRYGIHPWGPPGSNALRRAPVCSRVDLQGLTLVSVPDHDRDLAAATLPGARLDPRPLEDASADPATRVLAVMIHDAVTPETLAAWPSLEAVVTRSDGHDHLSLAWMADKGLAAYHLGEYAAASVAELTLASLVALVRRVPEAMGRTRAGRWDRSDLEGRRLSECTVGVLGTGAIGSRVVRLLAGMGVPVVGHDIAPDPDLAALGGFRYEDDLDRFLAACDALSIHLPLDASTRGLLDAERLQRLPPGAVVVNTSRGAVLDHDALLAGLEEGRLGGFAADVLPGEPHPPDLERLAERADVLLTPHIGAHNQATLEERYRVTARIAEAVLSGRPETVGAYRLHAGRMG